MNRSDCESSDSELSDSDAPEPPPRFESLNTFPDLEDEESSVSESESDDENGSTPPPLPPPRNSELSESNEYVFTFFIYIITLIYSQF